MKNYGKIVSVLLVIWFLFAFFASSLSLFRNDSQRFGIGIAIAAVTPLVLFAIWFGASKGFRQFALSLNPQILTAAQAWRITGFTFVLLEARGGLPAMFALPAGYGDMAIGATAALVAWQLATPRHRNLFLLWQVLGIMDLIIAVALGTTAPLIDPHGISMVAMTMLPLSLVPTFLVPLFTILHLICIAQAKRRNAGSPVDLRTNPVHLTV
jgi:hypothetical protein